jgi:hypothetical protein
MGSRRDNNGPGTPGDSLKVAQQAELFASASPTASMASMETVMKKFNNTFEGTDCGDAGLPAHSRDVAKAKTVLRVVPKTPDIESIAPRTAAPKTQQGAEGTAALWVGLTRLRI